MRTIKFGIGFLSCDRHPEDPRDHAEIYRDMIELVQLAEEVGFNSAWTTEHHFTEGGYMPSVTTTMAALAQATDQIRIGSNVALGPLYKQPLRLAEDLATIDILSQGRLTFGVANGYRVKEFETFGIPTSERPGRLTELVKILRRAWTSQPFDFQGEFFSYEDIQVTPDPVQDGGPPILMGGFAPAAVQRAARHADGLTTGPLEGGLDGLSERVSLYESTVKEEDGSLSNRELLLWIPAFLHLKSDPWDVLKDVWKFRAEQYGRWYHEAGMIDDPSAVVSEENARQRCYDSVDDLVEDILVYRERFGPELHLMYECYIPGVPPEDLAHSVRAFGEQVIPNAK